MSLASHSYRKTALLPRFALLFVVAVSMGIAAGAAASQLTQGSFSAAGAQQLDGPGAAGVENGRMGVTGAMGEKQSPGGVSNLLPASSVATPVPEPSTHLLHGVASLVLCALGAARRGRREQA